MRMTDRYAWLLGAAIAVAAPAGADVVSDWNAKACATVAAAKLNTPVANRTMAIAQTAVLEAIKSSPGASREAAVSAANHAVLTALVPSQKDAIERAYREALASIAVGDARDKGVAIGVEAAARVMKLRADDGASTPESYRPTTAAGVYVPTTLPVVPQWPQRKPWLMTSPSQFRPGPPPELGSERWARDYNEVKALGAKERVDAHAGTDRDRALLGSDAALDLLRHRALGCRPARARPREECPPVSPPSRRPSTTRSSPYSTPSISTPSGVRSRRSGMATRMAMTRPSATVPGLR